MIQCSSLSLAYGGSCVFNDVSFSIGSGERCGLVGRNGSGKTSLLRLITKEETPDAGTISLPKGYTIGYLNQHISFSCPTLLEEACLGLKKEEREETFRAEKMLFGLGFMREDLLKSPLLFSGGFQLRLHLTKVLLSEPDCLLLDEPTNYLDILSLRFLERFLCRWKKELILVSHDREFMDSVTTHTLGIHRHQLRKIKGSTRDLFTLLVQEEENFERSRINQEKKLSSMQTFINRLGAKASKASQAQSRKKMIEKMPALEALTRIDELDFVFREKPFLGRKMGEVSSLSFSYSERRSLIHNVSFEIEPHARIAIIGKNGNGKSTLLSLIAKELTPQSGTITFSDHVTIGYFGQTNIHRLNPDRTIEEELFAANPLLAHVEVKRIAATMMFKGTLSEKKVSVLSGGEKSRTLLGKILAKPCNLLLLDEPTHHLDVESIEALIDALCAFSGAIIIVTHSELLLKRLAINSLIICHAEGQEFFRGSYEEFLERKGWEEEKEELKQPSKSEDRRKRAETQRERSSVLKPMQEEIKKTEKAIMILEEAQKKDQMKLIDAYKDGNSKEIQELSIKTGKQSKEIEELFERLIELTDRYEAAKKIFEN